MKTYCVVLPVYNNAGSVRDVIERILVQTRDLLVVDDGSTDMDLPAFCREKGVECLRHEVNRGKGAALRTAIEALKTRPFDYMIAIDADGQHYPEDIPSFLPAMEQEGALVVGCRDFNDPNVPDSSRIGRKISNFWMKLETGVDVDDCQSGYRAYPLKYITQLPCLTSRYNFETEILTRAAWANLPIVNLPIRSYYPPRGERVSHFHPLRDNLRISMIHAHLVGLRLLPFPKKKLIKPPKFDYSIFKPRKFIRYLLRENATPGGLAAAAFAGTLLAVLPLIGCHSIAILYAATKLHLNKLMAFNIQHLFMPPVAPALCIEAGYFLLHGRFLTEFNLETLWHQLDERFLEWLLGSLILAPLFAVITAACVYGIATLCRRSR
ncbi:MAG: DUF2062 domain-containing protein [Lentisphaeria bacterium]|nr:DUF2062 domain-containing protein [Lentisphaeria bacterium]